jgi:hypothetical protein
MFLWNRSAFVHFILVVYTCCDAKTVTTETTASVSEVSLVCGDRNRGLRRRQQRRQQQEHTTWIMACRGGGGGTTRENLQKWNVYFDTTTHEDEQMYARYAACLAATEGLRRHRDDAIRRGDPNAESQYVQDASKVVSALGMTVEEYNQIGATLLSSTRNRHNDHQNPNMLDLKQKVRA